jgi:hypothetical protein
MPEITYGGVLLMRTPVCGEILRDGAYNRPTAASDPPTPLEQLREPDQYGVEFLLRLHIGWTHQENGHLDEAKAEYDSALTVAVRPAEHLARLYLNLATIASQQGDQVRLVWAAKNVLSAERALGNETDKTRRARELLAQ